MSGRSIQAGRLGCELARDLRLLRVEVRWSGTNKSGSFGGWRVEWTDGPTVPVMRAHVEERAERFPAVPVADLSYDRCRTNLTEAVALPLYVDSDRYWVDRLECPLLLSGYDYVDWPERADEIWQNRAKALLRYARRPITTASAVNVLGTQAQAGWDSALAWLDRLAAEQSDEAEASNVVDLASRRDSTPCRRD
jgi:hypothetical protein